MKQKQTASQVREAFVLFIGGCAVGAEQTKKAVKKLSATAKKQWKKCAPLQENLRTKIQDAKEIYLQKQTKKHNGPGKTDT